MLSGMSFGQFTALTTFILTIGTISVTYWVGWSQETVAMCNPFLAGCTDITHTGLKGDAGFIFRGGLVSGCVFVLLWFMVMRVWLAKSIQTSKAKINLNMMTFFGVLAAVGLAWGTAVLAPTKDQVLWGPHIRGANTFFEGILLALSFAHYLIWKGQQSGALTVPSMKVKHVLLVLIWIVLIFFIANSVSEMMDHGTRIAEWWATFFIGGYFLSSYWDWSGVRLTSE